MTDLLTKAVGDIAAALVLAGHESKIADWIAPYAAAINQADASTLVDPDAMRAMRQELHDAEVELRRSRDAMTASTLCGRSRTDAAVERLRRAQEALEGAAHAG